MIALPKREAYIPPKEGRILLHSCCAPCCGEIMEGMKESGLKATVYFYNPNIFPRDEYEHRKQVNKDFAKKLGLPFIDGDYEADHKLWCARTEGLENEPEKGKRCDVCFLMRMEGTARFAHENAFQILATSLGISRHKDQAQVYAAARKAVEAYDDVMFWDFNWRIKGGADRGAQIAKRENFYRQDYCGCKYSLRDRDARQKQEK